MAFNGSGVFVRIYNWVNDAASNIKIRADRMDNEMNGFATGLTTCITKDGQTTPTANLPMAGFAHTGVGDGATRTYYTSIAQTQDGKINWVAAGGTADAITAAYAIPVTALVDGQVCFVRAANANATTTPTFSPSGLTARTIVKNGGQALAAGDIFGTGHELVLRYYLASTRWELLNPTVKSSVAVTNAAQTFTGGQRTAASALTSSSSSIAIDLALNNDFTHTFTENTTLANPSNIVAGQKGRIYLTQHASSPKTLAYGSFYKFSGGTAPTVTATNSAIDCLYYDVLDSTHIACNLVKGMA